MKGHRKSTRDFARKLGRQKVRLIRERVQRKEARRERE